MKKLISLVLSICMLVTMLPMGIMSVSALTANVTVTATPASSTEITTIQKYIELEFGEAVNPDTITKENITMTTDADDPIKGAYVLENVLTDDAVTGVKVKFGRLDAGDYKITVSDAVKSADGLMSVEETTLNYTAEEPAPTANITFDAPGKNEYTIGESYTSTSDAEVGAGRLNFTSRNAQDEPANSTIKIDEESNGDAYLELKINGAVTQTQGVNAMLGTEDTYETYLADTLDAYVTEVEAKFVKNGSATNESRILQGYGFVYSLNYTDGAYKTANLMSGNGSPLSTAGNGYITAKSVFLRKGELNGFVHDVYDGVGNRYIGRLKHSNGSEREIADNVRYTYLAYIQSGAAAADEADALRISTIKQYKEVLPSVLDQEYKSAENQMVFHMSDDILVGEGNAPIGAITVKNASSEDQEFTAVVDNSKRTLTLTFTRKLPLGDYTVDLSALQSANNGLKMCNADNMSSAITVNVSETCGENITVSSDVPEGSISTIQKYVTLDFTEAVNPETVTKTNITMTTDDGEPIKGAYVLEEVKSGEDVIGVKVHFGRLDDGQGYKINVSDNVLSKDSTNKVTAKTFTYTAAEPAPTANITFDAPGKNEYTIGESYTSTSDAEVGAGRLNFTSRNAQDEPANSTIKIDEESNGDAYLELKINGAVTQTQGVNAMLGTEDTYETYLTDTLDAYVTEVEAKFVQNGSASNESRMLQGNGFVYSLNYTGGAYKTANLMSSNGSPLSAASNGYITAKSVFLRKGELNGFVHDVYDGVGNRYIGRLKHSNGSEREIADNVRYTYLAYIQSGAAAADEADSIRISTIKQYKEVLPSVLDKEYKLAEKQMVFHMSDDILVGEGNVPVGEITVKNSASEDQEFTAVVDNSKRTLTLTFAKYLNEGNYTVDISALQSANNGLRMCNADNMSSAITVNVSETYIPPFEVSASVEDGGNISTIQKYITLNFTRPVDPETITESISMTKANGSAIKGVFLLEEVKSGEDVVGVKVNFGRLDAGSYKITVTNAVKAKGNTGESITAKTFTYTAVAPTSDTYITFDAPDKTEYSVGENYTSTSDTEHGASRLKFTKDDDIAENAAITTGKESDGDGYLEFKINGAVTQTQGVKAMLGTEDEYYETYLKDNLDVYVTEVEAKFKQNGATSNESRMLRLQGGINPTVNCATGVYKTMSLDSPKTFTQSDSGYITAKSVLLRDGTYSGSTPYVVQDIYDGVDNLYAGRLIYQEKDRKLTTGVRYTGSSGFIAYIKSGTATADEADAMRISTIKEYKEVLPRVLKQNDYNNANRQLVFDMSDDILEGSLSTITMKKGDEEFSGFVASVDNSKRTLTLDFKYGLVDGEYTVNLSGLQSANNGLRMCDADSISSNIKVTVSDSNYITNVSFKDGEDVLVTENVGAGQKLISEATTVSLSADVAYDDDFVVILAAYDAGGKLIKAEFAKLKEGSDVTYTASVAVPNKNARTAKMFVWESKNTIKQRFDAYVCK